MNIYFVLRKQLYVKHRNRVCHTDSPWLTTALFSDCLKLQLWKSRCTTGPWIHNGDSSGICLRWNEAQQADWTILLEPAEWEERNSRCRWGSQHPFLPSRLVWQAGKLIQTTLVKAFKKQGIIPYYSNISSHREN